MAQQRLLNSRLSHHQGRQIELTILLQLAINLTYFFFFLVSVVGQCWWTSKKAAMGPKNARNVRLDRVVHYSPSCPILHDVPDRTALSVIEHNVKPGTDITTDGWRVIASQYNHRFIRHKVPPGAPSFIIRLLFTRGNIIAGGMYVPFAAIILSISYQSHVLHCWRVALVCYQLPVTLEKNDVTICTTNRSFCYSIELILANLLMPQYVQFKYPYEEF